MELNNPLRRGYELRDVLGAGGFGTVYRAWQPAVRREVAIKVIKPQLSAHPGVGVAGPPGALKPADDDGIGADRRSASEEPPAAQSAGIAGSIGPVVCLEDLDFLVDPQRRQLVPRTRSFEV